MVEHLGIIFLHHDISDVVRNNLLSVERQNPDATIVTMSAGLPLPDGYSLRETPELEPWHSLAVTLMPQWLVCSWFLQRREKCDRWWIIEWDVFCRMPVEEYYRPVWRFPFIVPGIRLLQRDGFSWFEYVKSMPSEFRPFAVAGAPFLYLITEEALRKTCETMLNTPFDAGIGELHFPTIANYCGYPPCGYSPPNDLITWIAWKSLPKRRGIFHPVKFLADSGAYGKPTK